MNRNIEALARIAAKKERRIIGLMSGTSLDGLDIAVCLIKGSGFETTVTVEHFETIVYQQEFKDALREICFKENVSLRQLTLLHKNIAETHSSMVNAFLVKHHISKDDIALVASHGQTVYHIPQAHGPAATLQLGDADHIAYNTGIITISDFRQKNIAVGGEGAPLAAYGDLFLFSERDHDVLLLNIGGIANFSYLPAKGEMVSSDIGPGNTLMNAWMKANFPGKDHDKDARLALKGTVNNDLLAELNSNSFFKTSFPKTTGPELFNLEMLTDAMKKTAGKQLNVEDVMATLNQFSADQIISAINNTTKGNPYKIYISGGGIHNPLLMEHIKKGLTGASYHSVSKKNIPADGKEAVLFALLANECMAGDPSVFSDRATNLPAVCMGKISFPY